jgi:putative FmdB family regulatory protein
MPIYDYKCRNCGHQFELIVLRNTLAVCPQCQSAELEQLVSGFAVSTQAIRQANVKAARRMYAASKNYRDQKVAEADEIKEHAPHLVKPDLKPK